MFLRSEPFSRIYYVLCVEFRYTMIILAIFLAFFPLKTFAQTEVSSEVSGEWTVEGSPYIVIDSTWIPENEELRIGPGVEVLFADSLGLTASGGLTVNGTEEDSVRFLSQEEDLLWRGITISNQDFDYTFNYCAIRNNINAILSSNEVTIFLNNCTIQSDNRPIRSLNVNERDHYEINKCHITGNSRIAFRCAGFFAINSYIRTGSGEEWGIFNGSFGATILDSCTIIGSVDAWLGSSFRNCRFLSPNDSVTVYINPSVMLDCYIQGNVILGTSGGRLRIYNNIISGGLSGTIVNGADITNNYIGGSVDFRYYDSTRFENNHVIGSVRIQNDESETLYFRECDIFNSYDDEYAFFFRIPWEDAITTTIIERNTIYGSPYIFTRGSGDVIFTNNTIITDSADEQAIRFSARECDYKIVNNIFFSPESCNAVFWFSLNQQENIPDISYNCIWGYDNLLSDFNRRNDFQFELEESNITEDPLLAFAFPDLLLLQRGSPCIDAGDPESPLDPDSTRADIGRFYFHHENAISFRQYAVLDDFEMFSSYPNPFNSKLNIDFFNPLSQPITIVLYDINGRELIKEDSKWFNTGKHSVMLDGGFLPSGSYFVSLKSDKFVRYQKVELIR
ncbi:T9SS type A sorting domain-containing protein [bacterium]|nr:T9SS type A sorting domain-containing protein [bacterium]